MPEPLQLYSQHPYFVDAISSSVYMNVQNARLALSPGDSQTFRESNLESTELCMLVNLFLGLPYVLIHAF